MLTAKQAFLRHSVQYGISILTTALNTIAGEAVLGMNIELTIVSHPSLGKNNRPGRNTVLCFAHTCLLVKSVHLHYYGQEEIKGGYLRFPTFGLAHWNSRILIP